MGVIGEGREGVGRKGVKQRKINSSITVKNDKLPQTQFCTINLPNSF